MKNLWFCMCFLTGCLMMSLGQAVTIVETTDVVKEENTKTVVTTFRESCTWGKAQILESLNMDASKPTLLFFGGKGERSSAKATARLLNGVETFNNWNVICIAVARDNGYIREWQDVASDLKTYLQQRIAEGKINPQNIYIDSYSNGAAGGYYSAIELNNYPVYTDDGTITQIKIKEITFIEGTLPGVIKASQVDQLLNMGIDVTLYVSRNSSYNLSQHGRNLVKKFKDTPRFEGILVDHGHGNAIVSLVTNSYGNHENDGFF